MPLGTLRQQLIFPQYEDDTDVAIESDTALRKLASDVSLASALLPVHGIHPYSSTCEEN
jgi:hypothetical protein